MLESQSKKILVIEDEKAYSRALVFKLQNAGFETESVKNGEEALAIIKKSHFDLLLCDLVMPRMSGFELLEELKKQNIIIPTIVLSNLGQSNDENKVKALGVVDFLVKSDTPIANVLLKVQQFLFKKV